jgi:predicted HTH transcriptional regulator
MSIFAKPMPEVGTADLEELLQNGAVENARLEFKLQVPTKDETLKKLSSFANTFGGFMVVGASALSADGRIDDLPGVDVEAGYKQKVVDWCFSAASPPLLIEVSDPIPAPAGGGKVCYVVHAPESDVAPHFLNG